MQTRSKSRKRREREAADLEDDSDGTSSSKNRAKNPEPTTNEIAVKQSFFGTVNTIRSARFGAPGSGIKPSISYFKSTTISSQDELQAFCNKIKTHGHSRVKGPAGRVSINSPLADACESESIDFRLGDVVVVAVWSNRRHEPRIERIHAGDDSITVELRSDGVNRGAAQRSSGVKYGSYAAAVVRWKEGEQRDVKFGGDTGGLLLG